MYKKVQTKTKQKKCQLNFASYLDNCQSVSNKIPPVNLSRCVDSGNKTFCVVLCCLNERWIFLFRFSSFYCPFSSTKKVNVEIYLFQYCSNDHVYFLVLPQKSFLLGLYKPILHHLLGNTGKYSLSCQTNMENQLIQYCPTKKDNTGRN